MIFLYGFYCTIYLLLAIVSLKRKGHYWFSILNVSMVMYSISELLETLWWAEVLGYLFGLIALVCFFQTIRSLENYKNKGISIFLYSIFLLLTINIGQILLGGLWGNSRDTPIPTTENSMVFQIIGIITLASSLILLLLYAFLSMLYEEKKQSNFAAKLFIWSCITLVGLGHNSLVDFGVVQNSPSIPILLFSGILYFRFFLQNKQSTVTD